MPLPLDTDYHDEELERYVLGLLPDEATDRLDEATIADDEVAARLRVIETDLIDRYVRGQLAGSTLERFEAHYLSSPRRRQSVRLAARFIRAVDRRVEVADGVKRADTDRVVRPARLTWMAAAAAVAILACGVFVFEFAGPRNETTFSRSESALVLRPPTRAPAPIPTLTIPTSAERVRFELQLESNDFPSYRVELKDPATGAGLWRSGWILPTSSADQPSVSVVVPASLFHPRYYLLDLAGRGGGGAEPIGTYTVLITP